MAARPLQLLIQQAEPGNHEVAVMDIYLVCLLRPQNFEPEMMKQSNILVRQSRPMRAERKCLRLSACVDQFTNNQPMLTAGNLFPSRAEPQALFVRSQCGRPACDDPRRFQAKGSVGDALKRIS